MTYIDHQDHIYTIRKFLTVLRERKSNPMYDKEQCEEMIAALEAAVVALEEQVLA